MQFEEPFVFRHGLAGPTGLEQGVRVSAPTILAVRVAIAKLPKPLQGRLQIAGLDCIARSVEKYVGLELLFLR